LIALNIPPGFLGRSYGFQKWNDFDQDLWSKIESETSIRNDLKFNII